MSMTVIFGANDGYVVGSDLPEFNFDSKASLEFLRRHLLPIDARESTTRMLNNILERDGLDAACTAARRTAYAAAAFLMAHRGIRQIDRIIKIIRAIYAKHEGRWFH